MFRLATPATAASPATAAAPAAAPAGARPAPFSAFDVVAIASSLGGPEALGTILGALPPDFPAAVLVAQHRGPGSRFLATNLGRDSALPVREAVAGEPATPGIVHLAPPDRHLLVDGERRLVVQNGPRVKFCRPSAEPLFVSVAAEYRERAIGVVLTGCNTDGAFGVQSIKWLGGRVLAQSPETARGRGMPLAAIASGAVDFVLPVGAIAPALVALVMARGAAAWLKVTRAA
jgi:two-component system chemotaxis response regulator CheB